MPRTVTKTYQLFTFDELSEDAKQRARDWFPSGGEESTIAYEYICEDAERIGVRITRLSASRSNQGDFIGSATGTAKAIVKEHGPECETFKTTAVFLTDTARLNIAEREAEDDSNDFGAAREALPANELVRDGGQFGMGA